MVTKTRTRKEVVEDPAPVMEKRMSPVEKKLDKMGLHAQFEHYRFDDRSAMTACTLEDSARMPVAVGFAICSHKDNFCRATGRKISTTRAMAALSAKRNLFPLMNHGHTNTAMAEFVSTWKFMAEYKVLKLDT